MYAFDAGFHLFLEQWFQNGGYYSIQFIYSSCSKYTDTSVDETYAHKIAQV